MIRQGRSVTQHGIETSRGSPDSSPGSQERHLRESDGLSIAVPGGSSAERGRHA